MYKRILNYLIFSFKILLTNIAFEMLIMKRSVNCLLI